MEINATKELLLLIAKGDEEAFKQLFDLYRARLYAYICKMIKSKEAAEEMVMDIFMKIWLGKDMIIKINNFDAFLFQVAYHKSIDFLRSAAKDLMLHDLLWEKIQLQEKTSADSHLLLQEYENKVREAIGLLSPQRKLVFNLRREEGLSHDQIANRLHLSKHTINNHIVEAKSFIRTYLIQNLDLAMLVLFFLWK